MPDFVDPYLEPESGILRNRLGLTDRATLDRAEAELTEWRRAEMITRPVKVTGDLRQLQAIHRQLFQDVYDWAGQLRTVDIRKGTDPGAEFFMPVSRLESGAGFAFAELADEHQLHGLDRDRFVDRLAHCAPRWSTPRSAGRRSPPAPDSTSTGAESPGRRTTGRHVPLWNARTSPNCAGSSTASCSPPREAG